MKDTPEDNTRIQLEIMLAKSESERFRIGDELISFGRMVLENSIRQEFPAISENDLKAEVFKRCYSSFYSPGELQKILLSMEEYCRRNKSRPASYLLFHPVPRTYF